MFLKHAMVFMNTHLSPNNIAIKNVTVVVPFNNYPSCHTIAWYSLGAKQKLRLITSNVSSTVLATVAYVHSLKVFYFVNHYELSDVPKPISLRDSQNK